MSLLYIFRRKKPAPNENYRKKSFACVWLWFAVEYSRTLRKDVFHYMIKVDISNVWGQLTLGDLLAMEKEVADAHTTLVDGTGEGNDFLGWLNLPVREPTEEIKRIQSAAKKIRENSDVFVVIGIGGSYLGPRAAIELLQGPNHNIGKGKGNPQIFFAGNGLSTRHWNELQGLLEDKDFSTDLDSLYNTYLHGGLPVGPICNPGLASIRAAVNPNDTDYYYFAYGKDGVSHFFRTFNEHLAFVNSDMYAPG